MYSCSFCLFILATVGSADVGLLDYVFGRIRTSEGIHGWYSTRQVRTYIVMLFYIIFEQRIRLYDTVCDVERDLCNE